MLIDIYSGTGLTLEEASARAAWAEAEGFAALWTVESASEPFGSLVLAAQATRTLTLGTGIAVAFARSPMLMAQAAYELNRFSEGRLLLGIGSQVRGHITRRFSQPWSEPAARMAEYIEAMRAIWRCWQDGEALDFNGKFYTHNLMTPATIPSRFDGPVPKVLLAAVGPRMTRVAALHADGIVAHPYTSQKYLSEVTLPVLRQARAEVDRADEAFDIVLPVLVGSGLTDEAFENSVTALRRQIGFYASTPSYVGVMDLHGAADVARELTRRVKMGEWDRLGELIGDDLLNTFGVVAPPERLARAVGDRYGDLVTRAALYSAAVEPLELWQRVMAHA